MKKFIKNNVKTLIAFIVGGVIFGGVSIVAAGVIQSSAVTYTKNSQSTVEGALDTLYTRSNTTITNLQNQVSTLQSQLDAAPTQEQLTAAQAACPSGKDCVKKVETGTNSPTEYDINGEKFIVIWSNQYETALISKYNVSTSTKKQVSSSSGFVAFSSSTYWYSGGLKADYTANGASFSGNPYPYVYNSQNNLYTYLNDYKTYLNSSTVKIIRLATYEELVNLGCTNSSSTSNCPSWIKNSASFWTGSAMDSSHAWAFNSGVGYLSGYSYSRVFGVRPVIIVSTSEL